MKFDVMSIIYIVIVLLALLVGLKKGFFRTLTSLIKGVVSFIVTLFVCEPVGKVIFRTQLGQNAAGKMAEFFASKGEMFNTLITPDNKAEVIGNALTNIHVPEMLHSFIASLIKVPEEGINLANSLANSLTLYICVAISFISIFIIIRLLIMLLNKLFKAIEQIPLVGIANKLLGLALNGIIGLLIVCLISYGVTFIVPMGNAVSNWLVESMYLDQSEVFTISKFFYENNFLVQIITFIQGLFV